MERTKSFNRILLAIDGSAESEAAVDATIDLARFSSAVVRVAHVWNLEPHRLHGRLDVETGREAEVLVAATVDRLVGAGVVADQEVFRADSSRVALAIAQVARAFQADLVVVGSRGLSNWESLFKQSVSHRVLTVIDCPVLVARSWPTAYLSSPRRLLVAVAGGDDVTPAVRAAAAIAGSRRCTVLAVHVPQVIVSAFGPGYFEGENEVRETVDRTVRELREAGLAADGLVPDSGPVGSTLTSIAEDWGADLIVTGSSRMGDAASLLLGSVSHELLHRSEVPVLVAERIKP